MSLASIPQTRYSHPMSRARKNILYDQCLAHITFKCHNSEFYFHSDAVKDAIIEIVAKNKKRYRIPIYDYVFMSSHPHFLIYIDEVDRFSNFMRQMNREIAELVNSIFSKTGQAIQDRYRSPVIENEAYAINTVGYIWLNPVRANMLKIEDAHEYKHCSLFYRYRGLKDPICDPYEELKENTGIDLTLGKSEQRFARDHLNSLISRELSDFCPEIMEHVHSLGSPEFIKRRVGFRSGSGPP